MVDMKNTPGGQLYLFQAPRVFQICHILPPRCLPQPPNRNASEARRWGGSPATTIVSAFWLKSAQCHGRSSTLTCRCPTRGDTLAVSAPSSGKMRRFSTLYGTSATPRALGSGSGASRKSFDAGSFLMATRGEELLLSLVFCWAKIGVESTLKDCD
jgi:hypothetical protein